MNLREKIARLLSPLLDVALRSRTTVKFFLTLGIFISANHLAYLIRFEFDVPPDMVGVMRRDDPDPGDREGARVPRVRAVPRLVAVRVDPGRAADRGRFRARVGPLRGGRLGTVGAIPCAEVDLPDGLGEHDGAGPRRTVPHPHGKGIAGQAEVRDRAARPDHRSGRGRSDDREGDRRERLPGDGTGRIHRRRHGEDRRADPRRESVGGPRADRRRLREIRRQRDHHRDPVRSAVGGASHRGALPRGDRDVPDPARHQRPDRRQGERPRAAERGPRGPAGARPGGVGCRPARAAHHGAHGDGDRGGGVDRLGAVPPDRAAVAGAPDPVRDRGEPAVLPRDGDAGEVPDPGPGPGDRRRARPGKGRGDRPHPSSRDHLPRGGVQARADDGDPPRGGGEDERAGDADRGRGGREVRGGAVRSRLDGQGGAPDERDGGDEAAGRARDPQHRRPAGADGVRRRPVRQRPRQRGERDPDLPQGNCRRRGS